MGLCSGSGVVFDLDVGIERTLTKAADDNAGAATNTWEDRAKFRGISINRRTGL